MRTINGQYYNGDACDEYDIIYEDIKDELYDMIYEYIRKEYPGVDEETATDYCLEMINSYGTK